MKDITRRNRDRERVRVDRTQTLWLTLGAAVSLGITFALGFLMGQRAGRLAEAEAPPVVAEALLEKPAGPDLTFYDELTAPGPVTRSPPPKAPEAAALPQSGAGGPAVELPSGTRDSEDVPAAAAAAKPAAAKGSAPARNAPAVSEAVERARRAAAPGDEALLEAINGGPAAPGDYTVQVSAFQSMGEAKAFSAGLERKGFRPFVVTSTLDGRGTWYRVRLGKFDTEQTAARAKQQLALADIPAWVLRAE